MKNYYALHKPKGIRKTYRIELQSRDGVTRTSTTLKLPTVDSINADYLSGRIDYIMAEKNLKAVIKELKIQAGLSKAPLVFHEDNLKTVKDYFAKVYRHRDVIDRDSAENALTRSVEALGNISIISATEDQLQDQVNRVIGANRQRRVVSKLLVLLKFIGRHDIHLSKKRAERKTIKHLTREELEKVLIDLADAPELCLLIKVAFFTGARQGECFALTGQHRDRSVTIGTQIDREGAERETKNRRVRTVVIPTEAINTLNYWGEIRATFPLSRTAVLRKFKRACLSACGKKLCFHDLRHSFAIDLLNKGATIEEVAASLGDSVQVAQEHYTGFVLTSGSTERLKRIVA
jgi:integrase